MAVARRTTRQVGIAPLPGARRTAAETPESQGAGLERARGQRAGVAADVLAGMAGLAATGYQTQQRERVRIEKEERDNADETARLKWTNTISAWKSERLYHPETGALTLRGEAAQPLPEQIRTDFDAVAGQIAAGLSTDEQRRAFERDRIQAWAQTDLEVRRHVYGEMQTFRASELKAATDNGVNEAIRAAADPDLVRRSLVGVEEQLRVNLPKLGVGEEGVEAQIGAVRSQVHVGVIGQLLATDQDRKAAVYFEETRGQIDGDQIDNIQRALEEGSIRGESQKVADQIIAAGGTLKEQLAKARDLEPKVREAVEQRIEHAKTLEDRVIKESEEATQRRAFDILDRTPDVTKIPPAMWTAFDGNTRAALKSYAEHKAKGVPIKTDLPTYYALMRQAMNSPEAFAEENLLQHRGRLEEAEFKQLAGLQVSIKNGARMAAEKVIAEFRTAQQVVDDALVSMGIDPNATVAKEPAKATSVANLRRMVDIRIADLQAVTGKKATTKDVQSIVDGLLAATVTVRGTYSGIFPGGAPFYDTTKPAITATIEDISKDQRAQIEAALRARNRPVTDATILQTYLEAVARGKVK